MSDLTHDISAEVLSDDGIALRLIRFLAIGDSSKRDSASAFLACAPEYRFAIHRHGDGHRVGRIHVRITDHPDVVPVLGHVGFAIDEAHRGQGYATRAVRLIVAVAAHLGQTSLTVLIEPDNVASRRTVERAGFTLAHETDTHPAAVALGLGPRVCVYTASTGTR